MYDVLKYSICEAIDRVKLCTELVMDNRPLVGPMGQAYLKSDEYGKTSAAKQIVP